MPSPDEVSEALNAFGNVARPDAAANRDLLPERDSVPAAREARGELRPEAVLRPRSALAPWPLEIAFLGQYGVAPSVLGAASRTAQRQGVSADLALLVSGAVSEHHFYRSLARHLRLAFLDQSAPIDATAAYPHAIYAGLAPLGDPASEAVLIAPRGSAISELILSARRGELRGRVAITTPSHFARILRAAFRTQIRHDASFALPFLDPALCAKSSRWRWGPYAVIGICIAVLFVALKIAGTAPICAILLGLALLAMVLLRIMASVASLGACPRRPPRLADKDLPVYSIVVALYREARMVPQLIAALDRLDYPAAKLDIKFVIEEDDPETRLALKRLVRPPLHEIIIAPDGAPRTKPRALNVALPLLRGQYTAIFDAEDVPAPEQLRLAAERFARAPQELACLQARLVIDNLDAGWLPQLFAIEYAALFDVVNVGLADLKLPFPLGGSSNHFRTNILRKLGGWDAWNVTEDADIGFRFARFGYYSETLASATLEEAPATLRSFIGQRRRWCKGWYQTLCTVCRNPHRLYREVGVKRMLVMLITLLASVLVPLGLPLFTISLGIFIAKGAIPWPKTGFEIAASTLWTSVFSFGAAALLLPIFLGMMRRRLLPLWPKLVLLPLYYGIVSVAAWIGLFDFAVRPYHWCKTEHGLGAKKRLPRPFPWSAPATSKIATLRIDASQRVS